MAETTPDNARVIAPPPLLYLGPLLVGLGVNRLRPARLLPPALARGIGAALVAVATTLEVAFILAMRRAHTPINPSRAATRLVTNGPFRLTRNPSYLAFALYYLGIASLVNTRWPVLLLPAVLLAIQRGVIEREERYLERRFGQEYHDYRARVHRWL
jgi:protein-S-isoprenylcysteine O-methyltransferase Ste14